MPTWVASSTRNGLHAREADITKNEQKALQFAGKLFLEMDALVLSKAIKSGVLLEVHGEQDH